MKMKRMCKSFVVALGLLLVLSLPGVAEAFTNLNITGSIEFDSGNTYAHDTASGSGGMTLTSGGSDTSTSFDGTGSFVGSNPLNVSLTDIGDGVGGNAAFSGTNPSEYLTGWDLTLGLQNTSATDTYQVNFRIDYDNSVDSSGDDSFGRSEFLVGTTSGGDDIFASFLFSDTVNGNEDTAGPAAGFGGPMSEVGPYLFFINIGPLESLSLFGLWTLDGGVYADPGASLASIDSFISITGVENLTTPIPEPGTLVLLGSGLVGLVFAANRRRKHS